jgi:hypothetical protein
MVRAGIDNKAPYYAVCRAADNHGPFVQYRALGCSGPCGTAYVDSSFDEDAVFTRIEVTHAGGTTTASGYASLDYVNWSQIGRSVTFPTNLDLVGFAATSHGSTQSSSSSAE